MPSDNESDRERTNVYLDVESKEIVRDKLPNTSVAAECRRGVNAAAYGKKVVEADEKNDLARSQLDSSLSEIEDTIEWFEEASEEEGADAFSAETVVERLEVLRASINDNVEQQIRDREKAAKDGPSQANEKLEEHLTALDSLLQDGTHVFPEHGRIRDAAKVSGMRPEDVIELLKERNPEIPDRKFQEKSMDNYHA
ncbi:hypothetical protein [Halopelagius fulvigenes]|uniref:Uncharacterized protein n=1 Tax=Halopelagius fulvigenes TaxID=1198324 RepID=A0ABD5U3Q4_9EURY